MEIEILENEKTRLHFKLIGADHTFCNALKKELLLDKDVAVATYAIDHPQIGIPNFLVETAKGDPKKALQKAIKGLQGKNKLFVAAFSKAAN